MFKRLIAALVLAALPLAAGCLKLGPDYARPKPAAKPPAAGYQHAENRAKALANLSWWRDFGNPQMDLLVKRALDRNLDLKRAAALVLMRAAALTQTDSQRYPALNLSGQAAKSQSVISTLLSPKGGNYIAEGYQTSLAASYELDLWGRVARSSEAARADLLSAEESLRTVAQTVIAGVVSGLLRVEAAERRLVVNRKSIEAYRRSLEVVRFRYERGLVSVLDLRQARRSLANAQAGAPQIELELGQAQQDLRVLLGDYPQTSPAKRHPEDYFQLLPPVPAGLPSALMRRRPDVRQAEADLVALNARVGVAKASRFPTISLTASFGYSSSDLENLFKTTNELWSLAAGLSAPIFNAGRLEAAQRQAEAAYGQGVAVYAKTVLNAFAEVERALLSRKLYLERRERQLVALEEAKGAQDEAQDRYQRGLETYITVLTAQTTRYQMEDALVQIDQAILTNRVSLYRALGGGWENLSKAKKVNGEQS